jgi:hypothetical protein
MASHNLTQGSVTQTGAGVFVGRCDRYGVRSEASTFEGAMATLRKGIRGAMNASRSYRGNIATEILVITRTSPASPQTTVTSMLENDGM